MTPIPLGARQGYRVAMVGTSRMGSFRTYRLAPGRRIVRKTGGGALIEITVQVVFVTVTLFGMS